MQPGHCAADCVDNLREEITERHGLPGAMVITIGDLRTIGPHPVLGTNLQGKELSSFRFEGKGVAVQQFADLEGAKVLDRFPTLDHRRPLLFCWQRLHQACHGGCPGASLPEGHDWCRCRRGWPARHGRRMELLQRPLIRGLQKLGLLLLALLQMILVQPLLELQRVPTGDAYVFHVQVVHLKQGFHLVEPVLQEITSILPKAN
mmetsp:Transcript_135810/g.352152  ORF Transcript_135810/g.352152 Transcript_135810/m.352152 type:complete len:204 (-) Transcript_135810:597-1208(-)